MFSAKKITVVILCLLCFQTARAEWTKRESGTLAWLRDVYFLNENKGFVGGGGGAFLTTDDAGRTWTAHGKFTDDAIEQIYFSDKNTGWLLCSRNQPNRAGNSPSYLLKTNDGGASWKQFDFGAGRERVTKIFFAPDGSAMAVGESGVLLISGNGAEKWKRIAPVTRYLLFDGRFTDDSHAFVAGAGGSLFFTEDAGASWNAATILSDSKPKLNKIFFVNQKSGWAAGGAGKIFQTINGGKSWREQNSGVAQNLNDIFFLNTAEGWAVGDAGTMLHTTTAGNVWTAIAPKTAHRLEKIFFGGRKGWAVGFGGTILEFDETKANSDSSSKPQMRKQSEQPLKPL